MLLKYIIVSRYMCYFIHQTLMPSYFLFIKTYFLLKNKFNKRTFLCFEKREIKKYVSLNIEVVLNSCLIVFFFMNSKKYEIKVMCYVMMYELHMIKNCI